LHTVRPPSQLCDARHFAPRDVDTILGRIAEHAMMSVTVNVFGQAHFVANQVL
jgi:hypothetical protein